MNIKQECTNTVDAVLVIKPEPVSPERCRQHQISNNPGPISAEPEPLYNSTLHAPLPLSEQGSQTARPSGKFSASRLANQDKTVDLSSYQYGLYSYFAEGNKAHEFDEPHFDPYYGQTDIKDPALLLRAKQYFESLRQERCEDSEDYQMREQSGDHRVHRPMYQRKRKKLQRLVVLVPKIPISTAIKGYLRKMYLNNANCNSRSGRKESYTSLECSQEEKLQEFMRQFQAGTSRTHSRPYSVSQRSEKNKRTQGCPVVEMPSFCSREASCTTSNSEVSRDPSPVRNITNDQTQFPGNVPENVQYDSYNLDINKDSLSVESANIPLNSNIKPEPLEYACLSETSNPIMKIKQEIMDCSYNDHVDSAEPEVNTDSELSTGLGSLIPVCNRPAVENTVNPVIKQEVIDPVTDIMLQNEGTANAPSFVDSSHKDTSESGLHAQRSKGQIDGSTVPKKKKVCKPFQILIKQEPIDPIETESSRSDANPEKELFTSESPSCADDNKDISHTEVAQNRLPENVSIKEEPLDAEQLLMVKIFRKRVKKLKMIKVQPMVSVKEEPADFEDEMPELESPEIKDEPEEPSLLYFDPKPTTKQETINKRKPMIVYGRRIRPHARMAASHPRRRTSIDTESEFDKAAQIDTPVSPPRSAWSRLTDNSNNKSSEDEVDETAGLTAEIDKLIEAGNIKTLDDTERMYNLFASTIRTVKDPTANVFNIVLDRFMETKAIDESLKEVSNDSVPSSDPADSEATDSANNQILFPMSDQEIYNQGLAIVGESKPPEEFELPTIKVEPLENVVDEACVLADDLELPQHDSDITCNKSQSLPELSPSPIIEGYKNQVPANKPSCPTTVEDVSLSAIKPLKIASYSENLGSQTLSIHKQNSPDHLTSKTGILLREKHSEFSDKSDSKSDFEEQSNSLGSLAFQAITPDGCKELEPFKEKAAVSEDLNISFKNPSTENCTADKSDQFYSLPSDESFISGHRTESYCSNGPQTFVNDSVAQYGSEKENTSDVISPCCKSQPIGDYAVENISQCPAVPYQDNQISEDKIPTNISRQKRDVSDAERLFDEALAEEQNNFQAPEPAFLSEPFSRVTDNFFANSSFDDLIKVPLNTNEYLVKPKPSYVRMSYHNSSESVEGLKPPAVLFSAKSDDVKENPEWAQWKRNANNESFDNFQSSSWTIEDQSNPWSPQPSIYDSYFEPPPSSSASFEDLQKETSRAGSYDNTSSIEGRRLSMQGTYNPIIERNEQGQDIIRIPVEQRTVQTQFPATNKHCSSVDVSLPILTFIAQRQDNVTDIGTQTEDTCSYDSHYDYTTSAPLSSVLVEPLLSCSRKPLQPTPLLHPTTAPVTIATTSSTIGGNCCGTMTTVVRRTTQTQYPANNSLYSSFEQSLPFLGYANPIRDPSDSYTQTEGAPLFPPWVAPGRFRRHRPVLVEPLPTIEPIGENVRTMRSSDAYSILMEQIRTSHDCSFDKFMNSQTQPNGIVSKFNQYACYAPQEGNSPELPLTVKKNYPKKAADNVRKGKRPGIMYKEVAPKPIPSEHSNRGNFYNNVKSNIINIQFSSE